MTPSFNQVLDHHHPQFVQPQIPADLRFYATLNVTVTKDAGLSPYDLTNERILEALQGLGCLLAWNIDLNNTVEWEFELVVCNPWPTKMVTITRGGFAQPLKNGTEGSVASS